jgi:hypothetical protein
MSRVTEDRLLDCVLNEVLTALGCATLAAVPGAWIAYTHGVAGAVGALLAGLLTYACFTAWDHFGRARRTAELQQRVAELEDQLASVRRTDGAEPAAVIGQVRSVVLPSRELPDGSEPASGPEAAVAGEQPLRTSTPAAPRRLSIVRSEPEA